VTCAAQAISVTDGFFSTLGIPLLAGETFGATGEEPAEPVALVSQSLAKLLGGQQLIGNTFAWAMPARTNG